MTGLDEWVLHGDEMRRPLLVNPKIIESTKLVIVGAGLSGLCCAYRIAKKRPDLEVILHEKSSKFGGVISTWAENEWLCDVSVNATRPHPAFWRLIDDLNLNSFFVHLFYVYLFDSRHSPSLASNASKLRLIRMQTTYGNLFHATYQKRSKNFPKSFIGHNLAP